MIIDLSDEAQEFGREALRAFESAGGDLLVQRAEADPRPAMRSSAGVLADLGVWDLEPRGDMDSLEAAAAVCRSAGYWALPYPVAERLSRPADLDVDGLLVVADNRPSAPIVGVEASWAAVTLDGRRGIGWRAARPAGPHSSRPRPGATGRRRRPRTSRWR